MAIYEFSAFDHHERVVFCHDETTGLKAIIALHSTELGPAMGGCRMWNYANSDDALKDVLRLSRGMTYKNAMVNVPFGGGKSVIIGDPKTLKTPDLMRAYGRFVEKLGGDYICAEDVGTSPQDMEFVAEQTSHVLGRRCKSGDPSPFTAFGVFLGIQACVAYQLKRDTLAGIRVAVQGLGHVGWSLCEQLHQAGAALWVCDINPELTRKAQQQFCAQVVPLDNIYQQDVDVFAPCALGAVLNASTIVQMKAPIVAGSANNQLDTPEDDQRLAQKGILYAPDYVINAGGVINVSLEKGNYSATESRKRIKQIEQSLYAIFKRADHEKLPTGAIADIIAREHLSQIKNS